jgi:predicted DNA-binding WGR domain protein
MFTKDSMNKLTQFVVNAVPNEPTLKDFVHVSLHCYRPENNEDKVYLVTVHPGQSASMFHVTSHWGARTAKRLNSQLKAINVTKEAANAEVVKAKQEKVKGGYLPAPLSKVLSEEARSNLSASMGVSSSDSSKAKSKATAKAKTPVRDKAPSKLKALAPSTVKAPIKRAAKARVNTQENNKKGRVKIN